MKLTRQNTALVVDSTADLTPGLAQDPNVTMVPLNVHFGDETYRDWIDITPVEFYPRLREAERLPTTSQPSAGAFLEVYQDLTNTYERVFSLHLSGKLSGTVESARLAQAEAPAVTVIDTMSACVGVALLVDRLLAMLDRGVEEEVFVYFIESFSDRVGFLFIVSTLEYLQKGGRIGRAGRIAGSLLNIRPLLTMVDGEVDVYTKTRGEKKAFAAVHEFFLERTDPERPVYLAVAHSEAPEKAREIEALLLQTDREVEVRIRGMIGSVIGTYAGPGTLGLFFIQE